MNKRAIETVIVGLGRAGWDIHWRMLLKGRRDFRVVAVIDPVGERRQEAERDIGCPAFPSLDAFMNKPCGELVVLATPSGGHGAEALACLDRGFHVVVDKPMCQSVAEADAMMEMARQRRSVLTCFHIHRFGRKFLAIREVLRTGRLGRLVEIKATMSSFTRRNDWVMRKASGGGMHNVWGAHLVDQCLQLTGNPVKDVFSDLQCTVTPGDADDHCKIVMRCENGALIDVEISNCMAIPSVSPWIIAGTQGSLLMSPEGVKVKWFDPAKAPRLEVREGPAMGRRYGNDDTLPWEEEVIPLPEADSYGAFYDNLADVIRNGAPLAVTPESVRETIAVLELCRKQNPAVWAGIDS